MKQVIGRPTIRQLKRWCENQSIVKLDFKDQWAATSATIVKVKPTSNPEEEDYNVEITLRNKDPIPKTTSYKSREIIDYYIPEKKNSIVLNPENFSKKDLILQFRDKFWHVNKRMISTRSHFFHQLIKDKKKELSTWGLFISESKKPILINLDDLFDNKHQLLLLLHLLDLDDVDDFIYTTKDALHLFEIANNYPLQKNQTSLKKIENQIKNKFFELISEGIPFVKPNKLHSKAQLFLNNLQDELVAYCKRQNTKLCRHLLGYFSQIKKNNNVTIYAANLAHIESIRLLAFCGFKILTLNTVGLSPRLFKNCDLSPLPLHTLKMHPTPQGLPTEYCSWDYLQPLFNLIQNSKTLRLVQIGTPPRDINHINKSSVTSFIQASENSGFHFEPAAIKQFNSLKPILEARLRPFYEKAVELCFFRKFLPQQQGRYITELLTLEDLESLRLASHEIYADIKNSISSSNI